MLRQFPFRRLIQTLNLELPQNTFNHSRQTPWNIPGLDAANSAALEVRCIERWLNQLILHGKR